MRRGEGAKVQGGGAVGGEGRQQGQRQSCRGRGRAGRAEAGQQGQTQGAGQGPRELVVMQGGYSLCSHVQVAYVVMCRWPM